MQLQEKKLNIFFAQNYPTAETRYLKNFLVENGHAVAVRSKISKDKFHYEYANRQALRIDRLSSELLNEIDLFFIDQESLEALSNNEKAVLEESVKQGLGLLTFYNSKDKIKSSVFLSLSMKENLVDTVRLNLGSSAYTFSTLPVTVTDVVELPPVFTGVDFSTSNNAILHWTSITNHTYTIHYSTNLVSGFSPIVSNIPATLPINTYTDLIENVSQKFWKITTQE